MQQSFCLIENYNIPIIIIEYMIITKNNKQKYLVCSLINK